MSGCSRRRFIAIAAAAAAAAPGAARATGGVDVGDEAAAAHVVRVLLATGSFAPAQPLDAWHFAWQGRTLRGTASVVTLTDGRPGLVDSLPLDAYLYGVLSREISASWSPGAQGAQAIVARTYALGKLRPDRPYDLVAGDGDQNFGELESESVEGREAVDATSGAIVTYAGLAAHVAYSACCGGMTADSGDVWGTPYAYLGSIADPHCADSPGFAWRAEVGLAALETALGPDLAGAGGVREVAVLGEPAGRPRALGFVGSKGTVDVPLPRLRERVGPGVVRSAYVREASLEGRTLALAGTGRGHGVGLCQWGARSLGAAGASAAEIVAFYFPGTALGTA